jgi:hypothetical protein
VIRALASLGASLLIPGWESFDKHSIFKPGRGRSTVSGGLFHSGVRLTCCRSSARRGGAGRRGVLEALGGLVAQRDYVEAGYFEPGIQTTSARRSKTGKSRSTGDLQGIRDRAAKLSRLIDQIAKAVI